MNLIFKLIVLLIFLSCAVVNSQNINGKIVGINGGPLEYVNVLLLSNDSIFLSGTVSDHEGNFSFSNSEIRNYILKFSFLGYNDLFIKAIPSDSTLLIRMNSSPVYLDEVVISAEKKAYSMKNGNLIMNVQNTLLKTMGNAFDVLERLPNVILDDDDNLSVIGKGAPLVFVDGKEVYDKEELKRLNSNDIKNVEFVTTPGSQYDGEVKSVIKIATRKYLPYEGFSFRTQLKGNYGNKFSHKESLDFIYKISSFDFNVSFYDNRMKTNNYGEYNTVMYGDTVWRMKDSSRGNFQYANTNISANVSYLINNKHTLSFIYNYSKSKPLSHNNNRIEVQENSDYYDVILYNSLVKDKQKDNRYNLSYNGVFSESVNMNLNVDYFTKQTNQNQVNNETSNLLNRDIQSYSTNQYNIFASKLYFFYEPMKLLSMNFGFDALFTKRNGTFYNEQNILPSSNSVISENREAVYADLKISINKFSISAGLRYEYQKNIHENKLADPGDVFYKKTYHNLYPNLSIYYKIKNIEVSFLASKKTKRPTYYQLREGTQYNGRFEYDRGNPLLVPSRVTLFSISGVWKNLYIGTDYNRIEDYIGTMFYKDESSSSVKIATSINYKLNSNVVLSASYKKRIGVWTPQISLNYVIPDFEILYLDNIILLNKSYLLARMNNDFVFKRGYVISLNIFGNTSGNSGESLLGSKIVSNISFRKSYFDNKLDLLFNFNDIFKTFKRRSSNAIGFVYYDRDQYNDTKCISLTLTYKFNNFKNRRKKSMAGDEEINRAL